MRVLVTLNTLVLGGCPLNAIDFAQAARKHGIESTVVGFVETLPEAGPSIVDAAAARDVELLVLDVPFATAASAPSLARLADEQDIDVVHGYGGWDLRPAFHGPCRWGRRPLVQTVYEMYVPSLTYRHQPLIVGTGYLEDEQRGNRGGSVDLISPPVDLQADHPGHSPGALLEQFELDPSHHRIVIVSRLDRAMKAVGVGHAIEAIGELGRSDVDLVVVGAGDAEDQLEASAAKINEQLGYRAVVLCGPMQDPRPAYAAADIIFGMGSSAARALAFGKPLVVGGEHGWYRTFTPETSRDLFRNSFWSDLSEPTPAATLARHFRELIDAPETRQKLGVFGRRFAEENFGLEAMTERLVDVYERSLAHHRRRYWFLDLPQEALPGLAWLKRRLPVSAGKSHD